MRCLPARNIPLWVCLLSAGLVPSVTHAAVAVVTPDRYAQLRMTCATPLALTQDCSVRIGPTRPIAIDRFRMNIAAASDGRTVFISQVRSGPDHNLGEFAPSEDRRAEAVAAIRAVRQVLQPEGVCLRRWETIRHGRRVRGYLLTFSDDAYALLREQTVLESEHWLPGPLSRR
jgi:hypothetical protein